MEPGLYTLDEAAGLTGLSIEALRKRSKRPGPNRLRATKGNDGRVRVHLDDQVVQQIKREISALSIGRSTGQDLDKPATSDALSRAVDVLRDDAASLREALSRERARADQAEARAEAATALAEDRAVKLQETEAKLRTTSEKLARAEGVLEGLQIAAEATWWRRLRGLFHL